jgi:hypothetical protein
MRVLPIFEKKYPDDKRPRLAIEAALVFAADPSEKNKAAAYAADAAAYAAVWAAAWAAADAAYAAADAADAAADAAVAWAADAAYAAAYAAEQKAQADILRSIIPNPFSTQPKTKQKL